jgi:hypothetical protein
MGDRFLRGILRADDFYLLIRVFGRPAADAQGIDEVRSPFQAITAGVLNFPEDEKNCMRGRTMESPL